MFEALKTYLKFGNTFCAIEHLCEVGKCDNHGLLLGKVKTKLEIKKQFSYEEVEQLKVLVPKDQHVVLLINGSQVLTKIVVTDNKEDDVKLLYKSFPNIDPDLFYCEIHHGRGHAIVSVSRKEDVQNTINYYLENSIQVIDFRIGLGLVDNLVEHIDLEEFNTAGHKLIIEHGQIKSITKMADRANSQHVTISDLKINSYSIPCFSALLDLVQGIKDNGNLDVYRKGLTNEFLNKRFFKIGKSYGLVLIFALLLVNFLVFSHYYQKTNTLTTLVESQSISQGKVKKLQEEVNSSKSIVNSILKGQQSKSSFYINDISSSLPSEIQLTRLDYQPQTKQIKEGKPIALKDNVIMVSGTTSSSEIFSSWFEGLSNKHWISKVTIENYADQISGKSNFTINIRIEL